MKKLIKKISAILLLFFLALFVFRFIFSKKTIVQNAFNSHMEILEESFSNVRKNYASKEYTPINNSLSVKVDQKYEKVANITSRSNAYVYEEQLIRKQIKDFDALIQFEEKKGNKGHRKLNLHIGVPP